MNARHALRLSLALAFAITVAATPSRAFDAEFPVRVAAETQSASVGKKPITVKIDSDGGDIRVIAWPMHTVKLVSDGAGFDLEPTLEVDKDQAIVHIKSVTGEPTPNQGSARHTIYVPENANVLVYATYGDVMVNGVDGSVDVNLDHGNISLTDVRKARAIRTTDGIVRTDTSF
jgi:hypothetical protein